MSGDDMVYYDEETKTFSFPYDQKRIDAGKVIYDSDYVFHNMLIELRNTQAVINKYNIKSEITPLKRSKMIDYWDKIIAETSKRMIQTSCVLLYRANLIAKGGEYEY
ncbi:hypothetical protein KAR91_13670 [Candidatus Pacearchaeota archaeon]|nr:hypothetical protein [Candidatus Pacearchaeota archaeon]